MNDISLVLELAPLSWHRAYTAYLVEWWSIRAVLDLGVFSK